MALILLPPEKHLREIMKEERKNLDKAAMKVLHLKYDYLSHKLVLGGGHFYSASCACLTHGTSLDVFVNAVGIY